MANLKYQGSDTRKVVIPSSAFRGPVLLHFNLAVAVEGHETATEYLPGEAHAQRRRPDALQVQGICTSKTFLW